MKIQTGRRQFLRATAASAAAGPPLSASGLAATDHPETPLAAEFCVVGAGYAGLAAAHALHNAQRSVIVLEARDRVGGRVWSDLLSDNVTPVDLGGHWVGPTQTRILALAKAVGLESHIYESYNQGDFLAQKFDGTFARGFPAGAASQFFFLLTKLTAMAAEVPLNAPWDAADADVWDYLTVKAWLDANLEAGFVHDFLTVVMSELLSGSLGQSLLASLFQLRTAGSAFDLFGGPNDAQKFAIQDGAQAVASKVAAALGRNVLQLNAPVRQISQNATGVLVTSGRLTVRSSRVIVAIPRTLIGGIRFDPILPPEPAQVAQRLPMGSILKATFVYDKPFWRSAGLSGSTIGLKGSTLDGGAGAGEPGPGLLVFLQAGARARSIAHLPLRKRMRTLLAEIIKRFSAVGLGDQAGQLSRTLTYPQTGLPYTDHDWSKEEFSRGAFSGYFPPGVITGYRSAITDPVGRIHWAGTEIATQWNGYIDGAVQSGEAAAQQVMEAG